MWSFTWPYLHALFLYQQVIAKQEETYFHVKVVITVGIDDI